MSKNETGKMNNYRVKIRAEYRETGIENLTNHEMLEYLLFYSNHKENKTELANRLTERFGSVHRVFDASYEDILEVKGMTESSALLLALIPDICRKYIESGEQSNPDLSRTEAAKRYLCTRFIGESIEIFYMLCLNSSGKLIKCCKISEGITNEVLVDKNTVLREALRYKAHSVIFSHNHPRDIAAPSRKDIDLTKKLVYLMSTIDVKVKDHIIVAGRESFSMASFVTTKSIFDNPMLYFNLR